jgi:hypothetical protein
MTTTIDFDAVHRGTGGLLDLLTSEQIWQLAHLEPDDELQERITGLAARANEGELTPEERAEYEGYVEANSILAVLRATARRRLSDMDAVNW